MHKIQQTSPMPFPPPILSAVYLWPIQKATVIKSPIKNYSHLAAIALHIWLPLTEVDTLSEYNKRQLLVQASQNLGRKTERRESLQHSRT